MVNKMRVLHTPYMTLGSDPEIFVVDKTGAVIPAYKFLSSKAEGRHRTSPGDYGNLPMYWDGFQAEFETNPQQCLAWQVDSVQLGLKGVLAAAKLYDPDAQLSIASTIDVPVTELETAAPEYVSFGCTPSMNAYGMEGVKMDGREVPFRSAGGHIHLGVGNVGPEATVMAVKAMDAIIGVMCVSMFAGYDDPHRRILYGLAGEYRTPAHGIEYRVLSNAWLCHPLIMNLVFDVARKSYAFGINKYMQYWKADEADIINCINNCDVPLAHKMMEDNKEIILGILAGIYHDAANAVCVYNVFKNGIDSVILDPKDIAGNWNCNTTKVWVKHSDGLGKNWLTSKNIVPFGKKVS